VRGIDSRPFYTLTVFVGWLRRETTDLDPWKGDHSKNYVFGHSPKAWNCGPHRGPILLPHLFIRHGHPSRPFGPGCAGRPRRQARLFLSREHPHSYPHPLSPFGLKMPFFLRIYVGWVRFADELVWEFRAIYPLHLFLTSAVPSRSTCYLQLASRRAALWSRNRPEWPRYSLP